VDAFHQAVGARLPENRILSHDLLEGSYARAGLVSDVVLFEDFPSAYPVDVSRRHRWMRGDWQIAPWLLPRVPGAGGRGRINPLSILSQWKILDNIRRSLIPIAMLALLLIGWFLPGQAAFFTLLVGAIFLIPSILTALEQLTRQMNELKFTRRLRLIARSVGREALQECFVFSCLPYDAMLSLDAIGRTVLRVCITRRKMLEWRTARDAQQSHRNSLAGFYVSMMGQIVITAIAAAGVFYLHRPGIGITAPILGLWLLAPGVAWWLSLPSRSAIPRLLERDKSFLRQVARRTWRFFETYVTVEDHFLPPDNFQEDPPRGVAHRTSPTNIGLSLLANLAARDFAFICLGTMINRTTQAMETLDKLPRYRGHFYNWYDTRTLECLRPPYISTVDSGNLAAHLLTLAAGFDTLAGEKIVPEYLFDGLEATLHCALEASAPLGALGDDLRQRPRTLSGAHGLLQKFRGSAETALREAGSGADGELRYWLSALAEQCRQFEAELAELAPWIELQPPQELIQQSIGELHPLLRRLDETPTLAQCAAMEGALNDAIAAAGDSDYSRKLRAAVAGGAERAAARLAQLSRLAVRCRELADVEYEFLYDPVRRLLALGYHVAEHRLDAGYYDLLASEARLGSFMAIAQ
jgi:cyclic beta-1,2-glucan synthetase